MAIIFKNSSSPSMNSTRTHQKVVAPLIFFTLTTLLLASFFREFSLDSREKQGLSNHATSATPSPIPHPIIRTVCSRALYPSLCYISKNFIALRYILEFTMDAAEKFEARVRTHNLGFFTFQDLISQEKMGLNDCVEMLDQTLYELGLVMDDLHAFIASIGHLHLLYANIKTLLSAAMMNH